MEIVTKMKTIRPFFGLFDHFLAYGFFTSRLLILILLSPSITLTNSMKDSGDERLKQMESQLQQLDQKNILIDLKNDHQDREIQMLKTLMFKILNKENGNNAVLVTAPHEDILNNERIMQKRPVRLLPSYLFQTKEKKSIVGPPSSCKDLNELGHTLNGIYMVSKSRSNISKLDRSELLPLRAVFCNFQVIGENYPSLLRPPVKESKLGFVGLKSAEYGIHFYVQMRNNTSVPGKGVLTFDRIIFNVGGGMDFNTGVFTAPRAGVYTFSFSVAKHSFIFDYLEVSLRLNRVRVGHSQSGSGITTAPATLQSILKLKKGDRVDLWKSKGEIQQECSGYCHHFTGSLMEDLME